MKAKPKFLGVCSAIANKLEIDAIIVRILALLLILGTGIVPGLIVYFIASFLIDGD